MNTDLKQFILHSIIEKCTKGFNEGISVKALQQLYENHTLKHVTQNDIEYVIAEIYDDIGVINSYKIESRKLFIELK